MPSRAGIAAPATTTPQEPGNAWRLLAAARLAAGDPTGALAAAQAPLDIDRRLALPEKIARDWLLIGDIPTALQPAGSRLAAVRPGWPMQGPRSRRGGGLKEISLIASQALQAIGMQKIPAE
jgi:hypothetical protein